MLYIVRVGKTNESGMTLCTPCCACFRQMKRLGIKKIVYIDEEGDIVHTKVADLNVSHVSLGNRILSAKKIVYR